MEQHNHAVTPDEARVDLGVVPSPEEIAATALDEADGPSGYDIPLDEIDEIDEGAEEQPDPEPNAQCVFLVVITPDGSAFATSEVQKIAEILPQREATVQDMRRACQEVVHDVNAMQVAQQTVGLMQQQAQMMAEQQRSAKIAAKLQEKGIHVPRR